MRPYIILKKAGYDILFTGIITEKVIDSIHMDKLVGSFVTLQEAGQEVGKICNAYKNDDIDLTIVLTHIGFESDKHLAAILNPKWGVDMIIGGHSHTILEKPERINNILIVQAGTGTNQIGRFDIEVDDDTNSIVKYTWKAITVTNKLVAPDKNLTDYINSFQTEVDRKYNVIVTKLTKKLTHPKREVETTLGNLIADIFAEASQADIMFVGSGSVRVKELGPVVTLKDLKSCFPYDDSLNKFTVNGKQLIKIFSYIMRKSNRDGEGECYEINKAIHAVYNEKEKKLTSLTFNNKPVQENSLYTICIQGYHMNNCSAYLDISNKELIQNGPHKVITTSAYEVLEEFLKNNQNLSCRLSNRLIFT